MPVPLQRPYAIHQRLKHRIDIGSRLGARDVGTIAPIALAGIDQHAVASIGECRIAMLIMQHTTMRIDADNAGVGQGGLTLPRCAEVG
ncbi:hypothetical protein SAMN04487955_10183 [Halomonas korlensis]|uniref:Uncharacterized protein n=1 Tax=Halomonas korlensis TaxID=463301 RepID=A0A1I7EY06_9GAMM|nr:hypothetical protein SAMN04487955_10183 [Halomonas korlensis]